MARKTKLRYLRPAVLWREIIRAKQQTELPMNSPRLARSKEMKQTAGRALTARSQRGPRGSLLR
jgi:hypothetical protein